MEEEEDEEGLKKKREVRLVLKVSWRHDQHSESLHLDFALCSIEVLTIFISKPNKDPEGAEGGDMELILLHFPCSTSVTVPLCTSVTLTIKRLTGLI